MTHRELIQKAMPLVNLTDKEWDLVEKHIEKQDLVLKTAFNKLIQNQSKLEIVTNYLDYFGDRLDETTPKETFELHFI